MKFRGQNVFANKHFAITPSDSADVPDAPCIVYVVADGDAVIRDKFGTDITYTCVAGDVIPVMVYRVLDTNTTATVIGLK